MTHAQARLSGLSATLAILLLLVGAPLVLIAIGAAPWTSTCLEPDACSAHPTTGTLAMVVISGRRVGRVGGHGRVDRIEIVARLRGVHAPRLPGLALPQEAAGRLVAVASLLFVAVPMPAVAPLPAPPPAHGTAPARIEATALTPSASAQISRDAGRGSVGGRTRARHRRLRVKRGDTLWKIADQHLGDGARWPRSSI